MNRREFHTLLAASIAAPAAFAGRSAVAATAVPQGQYLWAAAVAKAQGSVSPQGISAALKVSPQAAEALCAQLVARGVTFAPGAGGVAQATTTILRDTIRPTIGKAPSTQFAALRKRLTQMATDVERPKRDAPGPDLSSEVGDQPLENSG